MKNKKITILIILIVIVGLILIGYGITNYLNNKNNVNKNQNKKTEEKDDYDPNSYNEYRDLEGLDKNLVLTDFVYENKDGKCEFSFTLTNNKDEDINNKLLKVNFYNKDKTLLNTFEYNIDYLGVHDRAEIKYYVEVKEDASIFDYEFEDTTNEIVLNK